MQPYYIPSYQIEYNSGDQLIIIHQEHTTVCKSIFTLLCNFTIHIKYNSIFNTILINYNRTISFKLGLPLLYCKATMVTYGSDRIRCWDSNQIFSGTQRRLPAGDNTCSRTTDCCPRPNSRGRKGPWSRWSRQGEDDTSWSSTGRRGHCSVSPPKRNLRRRGGLLRRRSTSKGLGWARTWAKPLRGRRPRPVNRRWPSPRVVQSLPVRQGKEAALDIHELLFESDGF